MTWYLICEHETVIGFTAASDYETARGILQAARTDRVVESDEDRPAFRCQVPGCCPEVST